MRNIQDSDDVRRRYEALLNESNDASVYQTIDWLLVFRSLGYELEFVEVDHHTLIPFVCKGKGILRRAFSLPYDTYGGAVTPEAHAIAYDEVFRTLAIPSARIVDYSGRAGSFDGKVEMATTHLVDLSGGYRVVSDAYSDANRRSLRQAVRRGLRVEAVSDPKLVGAFYRLYRKTMLRYHTPPLPMRFFESVYRYMVPKKLARFYLAWYGDVPVAGNLVLSFKNRAYDWSWVYDNAYLHLRPTNAIIDRAIRDHIEAGKLQFNLGASPANANGNAQFKENFGAQSYSYPILTKMGFCYHGARVIKGRGARLAERLGLRR